MAIARLHGGPLDGQVLPLENDDLEQLILPYSEGQLVYDRDGGPEHTGDDDGPTEVAFRFTEEPQEVTPDDDDVRPGE
ncbi:response regulator [Microbacterium rhizophilus]|uniref:response regulator n=1 Tax=Microbacterium rhizophilus TaxID=3138934 RepID=UPI0031EBA329